MNPQESELTVVLITSAIVLLLLAALVVIFVVVYQKRIIAQDMRVQQLETERQRELLSATIEGQERERKRLAKELHDGMASLLSGLKLNLRQQQMQPDLPEAQAQFLQEATSMLETGITDVRRMSHNLLPITLETFGLVQALRDWIEPLQQPGSFAVELQSNSPETRPKPAVELALLRVVQELLQNTIRHAQATEARIKLEFSPTDIQLHYADNGQGMQPGSKAGLGLKNMESRIHAVNGSIAFGSGSPPGFTASINVPIHHST